MRVLIYSHDTSGLGPLCRSRAIAHAIVERLEGVSVLIITGSQIAGACDDPARVDFVKIPTVLERRNGEPDSIDTFIDLRDVLYMRRSIIQRTAESFEPDVLIVDQEPLGLKGELEPTLELLAQRGARLVLGLHVLMDPPERLRQSEAMKRYYDRIWVHRGDLDGLEAICHDIDALVSRAPLRSRVSPKGPIRIRSTQSTSA